MDGRWWPEDVACALQGGNLVGGGHLAVQMHSVPRNCVEMVSSVADWVLGREGKNYHDSRELRNLWGNGKRRWQRVNDY